MPDSRRSCLRWNRLGLQPFEINLDSFIHADELGPSELTVSVGGGATQERSEVAADARRNGGVGEVAGGDGVVKGGDIVDGSCFVNVGDVTLN